MVEDIVTEFAIGCEAGVIAVIDVIVRDDITSPKGMHLAVPPLVIAAARQQLVTDAPVQRYPHADIGVLFHVAIYSINEGLLQGGRQSRLYRRHPAEKWHGEWRVR